MALRDYILNNFRLKVFSLLMAIALWISIQSNLPGDARFPQNPFRQMESREFVKTLLVTTTPANQQAFKIDPPQVRVTVRADRTLLKSVHGSEIEAYVDLSSS